jgi:hypothetical protein
MNNFQALAAAVFLGGPIVAGFVLVVGALFPRRVARTQAMAAASPGRALGIGSVNFAFLALTSFAFFVLADNLPLGLLVLPGTIVLGLLVIGLGFGLAGLTHHIGERLAPNAPPTVRAIWGALATTLACLMPVAGWFLVLPYVALSGLGAFLLSYLYTPEPRRAAEAVTPPSPPETLRREAVLRDEA